ncbi:MAG: recombinase family protein [Minisyncoccia bacterium]
MSKARKITDSSLGVNSLEGRLGLVYARVSSKRQETEGSGLQSQEDRCINDLRQIRVQYERSFLDSFSGGGDFMNRPAMRELLKHIDNNPHKKFMVVFDDLKRFARDVEFHLKLRTAFKARNVTLKCLNYNFDDSPEGRFAETVIAGSAELERHQNRRQVIQKQKARMELGYWPFGSKKGYTMTADREHGKISIPNKDGQLLKEALEGFANGTYVRKIDVCRFLVEKGFWNKQSPEKYIDKLTEFIKDPFYCGDLIYPKWEMSRRKGKHEGIISVETYEINQKRLGKLDFGKRIRTDLTDDFPLRGLLVCADCERHLTGAWAKGKKKRHPYYFCQNKHCQNFWKVIPREFAHDQLNELLKKIILKDEVSILVKKVFDSVWKEEIENFHNSIKSSDTRKRELENKITELTNLLISANNESLKKAYERQIVNSSEEIEAIENNHPVVNTEDLNIPYRTALEKSVTLLKSPYSVWVNLSTKEKQGLFYFIFDKKLALSRKGGYRTLEIPSAVRLFEDFVTSNTLDVEMTGIEPVCRRFL